MPFKNFTRLEIPDVILVEPVFFHDNRGGFFAELYKRTDFLTGGVPPRFCTGKSKQVQARCYSWTPLSTQTHGTGQIGHSG
ncbi:dTDP-4-dehydrorhamnose 3,5-epimerase family protein [Vulcanisaeta souniana]|uniref:dTDP-4-dehydrorhamnose 3,5-epimerase family protein n=1 Tax=Vulcanisaeta souniana TaxID=164452 RepID=UPI000A889D8F|nr:dTDP-4-dehydrorhamnose 3,5-epimerase family protein [Vulcanisaeta souniana]